MTVTDTDTPAPADEGSATARLEVLEALRDMQAYLAVQTALPADLHVTVSQAAAPGLPRGMRLDLLDQYASVMGTEVVPDAGSMVARKAIGNRATLVYYVEPEAAWIAARCREAAAGSAALTAPAQDVIPQGGRYGPAITFTAGAMAAAAPVPVEETGTCHACGAEAPVAGLEPTWFMGRSRLIHAGASCLRPGGTAGSAA